MTRPTRTVGDLIAELQQYNPALPVLVTCHFDNDDGLRHDPGVQVCSVSHSEAEFYLWTNRSDPNSFKAVVVA